MTDGEHMKAFAEKFDCSEHDMWKVAYAWFYGEVDGHDLARIEHDFGEYLHTLFQDEVVPIYVRAYVRQHKQTIMEA